MESKQHSNTFETLRSFEIQSEFDEKREHPSKILKENWKRLRNRAIKYCKVQWKNHLEREATWEKEEDLKRDYPELFRYRGNLNFGTKFVLRGRGCETP